MKHFLTALIVLFSLSLPLSAVHAETEKAALGQANVSIEVKDGVYFVTEQIKLLHPVHVPDGRLEHTLSKINRVQADNVAFTADHQELKIEEQDEGALKKVFVQIPDIQSDAFDYSITYQVTLPAGEYTVPLFVPMYAPEKSENAVDISFQAPDGMVVQQNSFPIVNVKNQSHIESKMINLPSHVSYIYGDHAPFLNSHSVISAVTLLILFLILWVWATVERKNARREA